jgi:hypothetical protein
MSTPESHELLTRIDELVSATRKGSFQWRTLNPTTYLWERTDPARGGEGARLTLQRVIQNVPQRPVPGQPLGSTRKAFFILQVVEVKRGGGQSPMLTISGSDEPEVNQKLEELFQQVSSGISEAGLEFLKNLISQG